MTAMMMLKVLVSLLKQRKRSEAEQQMDTTEETKGTEGMERKGKNGSKSMIKVKKSERSRVSTAILHYEPPIMRCRSSMMPRKTLGKWPLEQFENLEVEELQEVKDIAKMARMTPKPKTRGKAKKTLPAKVLKILDPGKMVIPHVFDSLLDIKPKNARVASLLSQDVGSQDIGINLTQFYSCVDKRVNHCSNRAQRARNFTSN